jgi:hypothetical protein
MLYITRTLSVFENFSVDAHAQPPKLFHNRSQLSTTEEGKPEEIERRKQKWPVISR